MHLSTRQLEAFVVVAHTLNFTKAAKRLNITQSALSQRVHKLEEQLGAALLVRAPGAVRLTDTGLRILRFCEARESLETEILADLASSHEGELAGVVRIAAHSSILRPVLIPVLAPLLRDNPRIHCELINAEARTAPDILKRGEAEFVIMDRPMALAALTSHHLGNEVYVVVESTAHRSRPDVFLDLEPDDRVTENFFTIQDERPRYRRSYMADVFGIIDGVAQGLGRAVISQHLIRDRRDLQVLSQYRPQVSGVHLHYYTQAYYTRLHDSIRRQLISGCAHYLAEPEPPSATAPPGGSES